MSQQPRDVPIREETIRLGQFLKLADLVDNGAEVKPLMIAGLVTVNGDTETRRGRRLCAMRSSPRTISIRWRCAVQKASDCR